MPLFKIQMKKTDVETYIIDAENIDKAEECAVCGDYLRIIESYPEDEEIIYSEEYIEEKENEMVH